MAKRKAPEGDNKEIQLETFNPPGRWSLREQREPSCFNGIVEVVRYRVSVERIEEPDEVIRARIGALWNASDNHHHWTPLQRVGARYGMTLVAGKKWKEGGE